MSTPSLLDQATEALKTGDTLQARNLLTQLLKTDPQEARAWLLLSACWNEPEKKRYCLEKASSLQPDDPQIRQALSDLAAQSGETAASAPAGEQSALLPVDLAGEAPAGTPAEATSPGEIAPVGAPPAGPPPTKQKPKSKHQAAAHKKKPNLLAQAGMLILLVVLALVAIAILLVVLQQTGIDLFSFIQPTTPAIQLPAEVPTFAMPPTWTPTSAPISTAPAGQPSATLFRPSATLPLTPTPVPSITPFFALWRIVIGQSVQDRPIEVYRFGTGKHERLIVAGIHGGSEANTIALANQLIEYLQKNPDRIPADVSLYILNSLNPDGEALGDKPEARFNAHGVDLNRNFDQNWKSSWKGSDCVSTDPQTAGPSAASEPETQAFMKFMLGRKVEALIDYHSAKLGIFPAGQPAAPASVKLAEAIAAVSPYAYPPVKTNCEFTGTLVDWAISQGTQAAVDLELNSSSDPEFENNLKILDVLLTWQP
jgi:Zinc carboxypeptidase